MSATSARIPQITAFACHEGRIAPVFDVARQLLLTREEGAEIRRFLAEIPDGPPERRVAFLMDLRVSALVCGAISRSLQESVEARGVAVTAFVAGEIESVVEAWRAGRLAGDEFAMPGCRGRMRRRGRCGAAAGEPAGSCACPACGFREPHVRGIPCAAKRCPRCQVPLVRA